MESLNRLLEPIRQKIRTLSGRALVTQINPSGAVQKLQVITEGGGAMDNVELIEPFGLTTSPPAGKQYGYYLKPNADGSQMLLFCVDGRKYRLEINADEASLYNSQGDRVHIRNNGEVHVKASAKVYAETPLFECTADCLVGGNLKVMGTTQLMQTTTIESGSFICAAASVFSAAVGFIAAVTHNGVTIGIEHQHSAGTEPDGTTGTVIP